jgi:peptidoglycan/xylan/chitin deacetylase (PgdA/CDA1 family)/uncharacterized caspase-like protein/predicted negative regulator of RcsB-dependent stress response
MNVRQPGAPAPVLVLVLSALVLASCRAAPPERSAGAGAAASTPTTQPASASATAAQPRRPLPEDVALIVEAYRKIIVLVEDESSLSGDDRQRASIVGRILYQQNHERLSRLTERLATELTGTRPATEAVALLDDLEQHPDLRDADKLAFMDLLTELIDATRAGRANSSGRALLPRLDADLEALKQIQALYNKELEKIFGRFETRGMTVRREAWEAYVSFLKTRYKAADIVKEQETGVAAVRGVAGAGSPASALEITGTRLPAKTLALTFDDGPHPRYTDKIREILKKYDVPAVFFHVGQNLGTIDAAMHVTATRAAAASGRLVSAGYVLGNHTFAHELLPKLSDRDIASQIDRADQMLRTVTTPSILFRPPYGAKNEAVLAAVEARHMKSVIWNIDSRDWADPIPESIANRVIQLADGERHGIVLFHDIQARTVDALPLVIETLQQRGYRFVGWNGSEFNSNDQAPAPAPASTEPSTLTRALYRESWAVVVGIDQYTHWPRLSYAGNDARAIREMLVEKLGFKPQNVTMLLNEQATRDKILSAIGDTLADPARVAREDRVFVFFAGHGATRKLPNGRALGYIVPVDADTANYQGTAISMTNFQDMSEAIPAKHVFFVMDACYSGIAATRGAQSYLQEMTRRVARQVLTAGGADQQVADNGPNGHSIFTWTLMQGLDGRADLNGDSYVTASELAAYVGPSVSAVSQQTPAFGNLPGSEGGEFVFAMKHETEFLSDESQQLDAEGIKLNAELDRVRAEVAAKRVRNEQLKSDIASARATLDAAPGSAAGASGAAAASAGAGPPGPGVATAAQLNDRGTVLFREKRYAEALAAFQDAAKQNPSNALSANNVGFAFFKLEQYPQAVQWFEKTIALDPRRAIAHANLGDAYLAMGRRADAKRHYERYIELQPTTRYASTVREKLQQLGVQ